MAASTSEGSCSNTGDLVAAIFEAPRGAMSSEKQTKKKKITGDRSFQGVHLIHPNSWVSLLSAQSSD